MTLRNSPDWKLFAFNERTSMVILRPQVVVEKLRTEVDNLAAARDDVDALRFGKI